MWAWALLPLISGDLGSRLQPQKIASVLSDGGTVAVQLVDGDVRLWSSSDLSACFESDAIPDVLRAWIVPADREAAVAPFWPAGLSWRGVIGGIGPGDLTCWLSDVPRDAAVQAALMRVGAQPAAVLHIHLAHETLRFGRLAPLAAGWRPVSGRSAELWPSPGDARRGVVRSTVCAVVGEVEPTIWIASPPHAFVADGRFDLFGDGGFVASGQVERDAERFLHGRLFAPSIVRSPQVGDEVVFRPRSGSAAAPPPGHVCEVRADGAAVVDLGGRDGVAEGARASAYRDGRRIGEVEFFSLRFEYGFVRPAVAATSLKRLDEIRFHPPAQPEIIGVAESVFACGIVTGVAWSDGESLASSEADDALEPNDARAPGLAWFRRGGEAVAAASVLEQSSGEFVAWVMPHSQRSPVEPGDELLRADADQ